MPVMEEQKKKKKGGWKRTVLIVICVILLLLLIAIACAAVYVNYLLDKIDINTEADSRLSASEVESLLETDPDVETIDPTSTETLPHIDDVTFPTEAEQPTYPSKSENVTNILLIGQDRREGEGRQRSDAMILVTFNKDTNDITLTSFMRDSYVQIPGYKPNKLNAAYQYGGFDLLNETLYVNFGVEVDGNAEVDFSGFEDLIDLLGGVDIKLTEAEVELLNYEWKDLKVGVNHLNGEQALDYSRIRYIDSDYRRAERQRKVLLSLVDAYKNKPITEMVALLDDILPLVKTNMSKSEIVSFVWDLFPMLSSAQFDTLRIPADGTFDQGNVKVREGLKNWFQYNIDFEANRKLLQEIFDDD